MNFETKYSSDKFRIAFEIDPQVRKTELTKIIF